MLHAPRILCTLLCTLLCALLCTLLCTPPARALQATEKALQLASRMRLPDGDELVARLEQSKVLWPPARTPAGTLAPVWVQ